MKTDEMKKIIERIERDTLALSFLRDGNRKFTIRVDGRNENGKVPFLDHESSHIIAKFLMPYIQEAASRAEAQIEAQIENDRLQILQLAK